MTCSNATPNTRKYFISFLTLFLGFFLLLLTSTDARGQIVPITSLIKPNGDTVLTVSRFGALEVGLRTEASGSESVAMGYESISTALRSFAMGHGAIATGNYSTAIGFGVGASGSSSVALGHGATASADQAVALGLNTEASGAHSFAMGRLSKATGTNSVAMGYGAVAGGTNSVAMGYGAIAEGNQSMAVGDSVIAPWANSLAIGTYNVETSFPILFVAGNGTAGNRSDALVLNRDGDLTIAGTLTQSSDRRLKEDIAPLGSVLGKLEGIAPVTFRFKEGVHRSTDSQIGLIAQDVQEAFPKLVGEGSNGYLTVSYTNLTAVLLKGLQEQQAQIEALQAEVEALRGGPVSAPLAGLLPVAGLLLGVLCVGGVVAWRRRGSLG